MNKPFITMSIKEPQEAVNTNAEKINIDPKSVEKGLGKLVLTLVELIRKLLEQQAARRVQAGSLADDEVEKIGETMIKLEEKMKELKDIFGLKDEDLNLDLGPLGDLI